MNAITLAPDLEQGAEEAIASGRFRDVMAVIRAGIGMLQRADAARAALLKSVQAAEEEGGRDGYATSNELMKQAQARLSRRSSE